MKRAVVCLPERLSAVPAGGSPTYGPDGFRRLKVLVSAYACDPAMGSEPGMGWNWVRHLAHHADLWVLIEENRYAPALAAGIERYPELRGRVHVVGIHRRRYAERLWSHLYYLSYRDWQRDAYHKAIDLHREIGFDLAHQLNMIGYREPGYLWKLPIPFVWGPIGGHAQMPWRFLPALDRKGAVHYGFRNVLNALQMRISLRVRKAMARADVLLAATREDQETIRRIHGREAVLLNEQGATPAEAGAGLPARMRGQPLKLAWCGIFVARKALPLGLHALRQALDSGVAVELDIIGSGTCDAEWRDLAERLGLARHCRWHGWLENREARRIIAGSDALLFTSLQEGTPAVVMEAIQAGVPVICHDACGFGSVVDEKCGIKIPMSNPETSVSGFAEALEKLQRSPEMARFLAQGASERARELAWPVKADAMAGLYRNAMHAYHHAAMAGVEA